MTSLFSQNTLFVSLSIRNNSPSSGMVGVTMLGVAVSRTTFSERPRLSRSACESAGPWNSYTSMTCRTPRGSDANAFLILTADADEPRSWTVAMSFDSTAPAIDALSTNAASSGASSVTIFGTNWEPVIGSLHLRILSTAAENTVWSSDTSCAGKASAWSCEPASCSPAPIGLARRP
mmetsp:Transcript_10331/g.24253  ORF Transcript_10331/g.24253 Transcript_10331/m.24253 type:complete len:177 (-) Transcript_10331:263-793(-)